MTDPLRDTEEGGESVRLVGKHHHECGWNFFFCGAGVLVCLADTDAGCLLVAADTGERFGYRLVLLQIMLIPMLFFAQELTARLGYGTGKGLTALIKEQYGFRAAAMMCGTLCINCLFALCTEIGGIAGVGRLWGLPMGYCVALSWLLTIGIFCLGSLDRVEKVGLFLGFFELIFIYTIFLAKPSAMVMEEELLDIPHTPEYYRSVGANIGAAIMPWCLFYQQSATAQKKERGQSPTLLMLRVDTFLGSTLTQFIMMGGMMTTAAIFTARGGATLTDVKSLQEAIAPLMGETASKLAISAAFIGGSLVATIVCSLACSWSISELLDQPSSLDQKLADAKIFFCTLFAFVTLASVIQFVTPDSSKVALFVECTNVLFAPFVLYFLFSAAQSDALGSKIRLAGGMKYLLGFLFVLASVAGVFSAVYGYSHALAGHHGGMMM